jgi:hypothetical protein
MGVEMNSVLSELAEDVAILRSKVIMGIQNGKSSPDQYAIPPVRTGT